jgi:glycosyltransferase involved in cell wall biosynthesis
MGPMFPVASIPTPVWNRMAGLSTATPRSTTIKPICLDGFIWDSRVAKLALEMTLPPLPATRPRKTPVQLPLRGYLLALAEPNAAAAQPHVSPGRISRIIARLAKRIQFLSRHPQTASGAVPTTSVFPPPWLPETDLPPIDEPALAVFDPDPYPAQQAQPPADAPALHLDGIVFTAVLSPKDGRKNWQDILSAFVFAFKTTPDATLVFKMIGTDPGYWWWEFHDAASRLPAFTCRVVVLHGYLDDENYGKLITATHFVTNASLAEGQCLPLVEFMSASRPAIAPDHTAMSDYITPQNAFVVESDIEYCAWPHDPRNLLRTTRYRIHWPSLRDAFTQAYEVAKTDPDAYAAMGNAAAATMQTYCGDKSTIASLQQILCLQPAVTAMLEAAVP